MVVKLVYSPLAHCWIGFTLNPEGLEILITEAMRKRQKHILNKKNLTISIDAALAQVIKDSHAISSELVFVLLFFYSYKWQVSSDAEYNQKRWKKSWKGSIQKDAQRTWDDWGYEGGNHKVKGRIKRM